MPEEKLTVAGNVLFMFNATYHIATSEMLPPKTGKAFILEEGMLLKVIDVEGEQVSDLIVFNFDDRDEVMSTGKTLDFAEKINITKGDQIYSNFDNVLLDIIEDTNGNNDMLLAPCSAATFKHFYNDNSGKPGCLGNLRNALMFFNISPAMICSSFNLFMNVEVRPSGKIEVLPPKSKAGDYILFKARKKLIVGLTACSAEMSNNYSFKPIKYEILREDDGV